MLNNLCPHNRKHVTEKTFIKTREWVRIAPPQKIGRLGLSNKDNVYAIDSEGNIEDHVGVVLDANLKKNVKCKFPDAKSPEGVKKSFLRVAPKEGANDLCPHDIAILSSWFMRGCPHA